MTDFPRRFFLPTGRVVRVVLPALREPVRRRGGAPLFSEVFELFESEGALLSDARSGAPLDVEALDLADFHALRAIVTAGGGIFEERIEFRCRNCEKALTHAPCAGLALGPFVDGELDDPELDQRLEVGLDHAIPPIQLGDGSHAETIRFGPVSVGLARPLFAALARPSLKLTAAVVTAMGISAIGSQTRPGPLARALQRATDEAWEAATQRFLDRHYPPRLFSIALCPECGARNDVDAPYEREFDTSGPPSSFCEEEDDARRPEFPAFDPFAELAARLFRDEVRARRLAGVELCVEEGVAACDDGGEPLLGSYVPGHPGDIASPTRPPTVSLYYRTFRAAFEDEPGFDWRSELEETIEHELDHHVAAMVGNDPVDEEEHREINDEARRVLGSRALTRTWFRDHGVDAIGFLQRTWPLWLIVVVTSLLALFSER